MDRSSITSLNDGKWTFDEYKVIKVIGAAKDRIAFQRKGKYMLYPVLWNIFKDQNHHEEELRMYCQRSYT